MANMGDGKIRNNCTVPKNQTNRTKPKILCYQNVLNDSNYIKINISSSKMNKLFNVKTYLAFKNEWFINPVTEHILYFEHFSIWFKLFCVIFFPFHLLASLLRTDVKNLKEMYEPVFNHKKANYYFDEMFERKYFERKYVDVLREMNLEEYLI